MTFVTRYYYVYILKCRDESLYVGITNDLENRIQIHNSGKNRSAYTYSRRPVELVWYEVFLDPETAIGFEKKLKRWSRKKKQALIDDDWKRVQELARCVNESSHLNYKPK